ncbi:hypothetical protein [Azospirillum doebereinerae]
MLKDRPTATGSERDRTGRDRLTEILDCLPGYREKTKD